jgi:putative peptidoglycan lipid II flippase
LFWQGFGIMLLGQILMSFTVIVDQFFAAHLGTGAIAMLNYANRILALILGMGAMAVSRATMPVFSQSHAQGGVQLSRIAAHWARLLFVLGIVAAIVGWFLAPWGVKLLFERGAFTAQDTAVVAGVLRYGLTQLPFYFAGLVFVSYLSSRGLYVWLLWSGVIGLCSKLLGNAFFIPAYGIGGIAFATAFMYATNFFFFWWVFQKTIRTV